MFFLTVLRLLYENIEIAQGRLAAQGKCYYVALTVRYGELHLDKRH
jgi:hypothetical protein